MKNRIFLCLLLVCSTSFYGQELSFFMYFEDSLGNVDSLELGLDPQASVEIDTTWGEENIIGTPWGAVLDVRSVDGFYPGYFEEVDKFHTKKQIVSENEFGNNLVTIGIKSDNYPITATWDSSLFSSLELEGSLITSIPPGGWWDVGSPSDLDKVLLKDQNRVTFSDNFLDGASTSEAYAYIEGGDSISLFWVAFGEKNIGVSNRKVIPDEILSIYPNPTSGTLFFTNKSDERIDYVEIIGLEGKKSKQIPWQNEVDVSSLPPSLYQLDIVFASGEKNGKEIAKGRIGREDSSRLFIGVKQEKSRTHDDLSASWSTLFRILRFLFLRRLPLN